LNGRRAARRRLLVRDLDALLDGRLFLVGGDHARRGDDVRLRFRLRRAQLEIDDEIAAEYAESKGTRRVAHRQIDVVAARPTRGSVGRRFPGLEPGLYVREAGRGPGGIAQAVLAFLVPVGHADDRTKLTFEVVGNDADARLDQPLPYRDIERRHQAAYV